MTPVRQAICAGTITLLGVAAPASADWLLLCDGAPGDGRRYLLPDGDQQSLLIADAPIDGCEAFPFDAPGELRWAGLVPASVAASTARGVGLLGVEADDAVSISEVVPSDPPSSAVPAARPALRLDAELLPLLEVAAFGTEGRARVTVGPDGVALSCQRGAQPAGLLLSTRERRLPIGARLAAAARYRATGDFPFGFSGPDQLRLETPVLIGRLVARDSEGATTIALPPAGSDGTHGFSVLCPGVAAELFLHRLTLRPADDVKLPSRATWVWEHGAWTDEPERLVRDLVAARMATVFVSVPLSGEPPRIANPDALRRFIDLASRAGIGVWAVEGDPAAVTIAGRENFVTRTQALSTFNSGRRPGSRLRGVQYDIEPYLLPGFDLDREGWLAAYLDTLRELRGAMTMPVEAAVPFWWSGLTSEGRPILEAMTAFVDGITVMNYRTDPGELHVNSLPYLEWAQQSSRYVRIALEAGPLADQTLLNFRPNEAGRLWQIDMGNATALLLWASPATNPAGRTFARTHAVPVPAGRTTFFGRRERLDELLPSLVRRWAIWPAYAGVALHEYLGQ